MENLLHVGEGLKKVEGCPKKGGWSISLLKIKKLINQKLNSWLIKLMRIWNPVIQKLGILSLNLQVRLPLLSISACYLDTSLPVIFKELLKLKIFEALYNVCQRFCLRRKTKDTWKIFSNFVKICLNCLRHLC